MPAAKKPTKKPKAKAKKPERSVMFPEVTSMVLQGDKALSLEDAFEILGWTEEPEGKDWGNDHCDVVSKMYGKRVRLLNNLINRPIDKGTVERYVQDILNGNWKLNGESIVRGCTGQVMSGQHRLIAMVLAEKERLENVQHWGKKHPDPIKLETVLVCGVEESDDVFRTLNTGKPASVADTLFRSTLLSRFPYAKRRPLSRVLDRAIAVCWHRLGYDCDQWADLRTNTEAQEFLEAHPGLLNCAEFLDTENSDSAISEVIPLGTATAFMYLMAARDTDFDLYHEKRFLGKASEKTLDMANFENAQKFWMGIASKQGTYEVVRDKIAKYNKDELGADVRQAVICLAWDLLMKGEEITSKGLTVKLTPAEEGKRRYVAENYTLGGVDRGDPVDPEETEEVVEEQPIEEQIVEDTSEDLGKAPDDGTEKPKGKAKKTKPKGKGFTNDLLLAAKEKYSEGLILFKGVEEAYFLGDDAYEAARVLVLDFDDPTAKLRKVTLPLETVDFQVGNLNRVGITVTVVNPDDLDAATIFKKRKKTPADAS